MAGNQDVVNEFENFLNMVGTKLKADLEVRKAILAEQEKGPGGG